MTTTLVPSSSLAQVKVVGNAQANSQGDVDTREFDLEMKKIADETDREIRKVLEDFEKEERTREGFTQGRLKLCRAAVARDDWPAEIKKQIAVNPDLGNWRELVEDCMLYLHGRQDALRPHL